MYNKFLDNLKLKLHQNFSIQSLEIEDDSADHRGHYDNLDENYPSHLHLTVVSSSFEGKTPLEKQRMVNEVLKEEFVKIHAVSMVLKSK